MIIESFSYQSSIEFLFFFWILDIIFIFIFLHFFLEIICIICFREQFSDLITEIRISRYQSRQYDSPGLPALFESLNLMKIALPIMDFCIKKIKLFDNQIPKKLFFLELEPDFIFSLSTSEQRSHPYITHH